MINIMAPINELGYGNVGYNVTTQLDKLTHVCLFPMYNKIEKTNVAIERCVENGQTFPVCNNNTPCIRIWHQNDMSQWVSSPRIGFPIFELNQFTDIEKNHLSIPDRLFVCSQWAYDIIQNQMGRNPDIVNLGYDPNIFYYKEVKKPNTTVFLNCGKFEIRKGHDILCHIFNSAFTTKDDVELWMINHNPFLTKEEHENIIKEYKQSPLGHKIKFFPRIQRQSQLAELMRNADFGIFPTRAEGWNLEGLEMIACGKPIITTNYSGHTDYTTANNSYLVNIKEFEPAYDGKWFFRQGDWAKIGKDELDQFINHMRTCYNNTVRKNVSITVKQLTWENTARRIYELV